MGLKHCEYSVIFHKNISMISYQNNPLQNAEDASRSLLLLSFWNYLSSVSNNFKKWRYLRSFPPVLDRNHWMHFWIVTPFFRVSKTVTNLEYKQSFKPILDPYIFPNYLCKFLYKNDMQESKREKIYSEISCDYCNHSVDTNVFTC